MKQYIQINEETLNKIIAETIEENIFDRLKQGVKGAIDGYRSQKYVDRGTDNFSQVYSRDDEKAMADPFARRPENTAADQANEIYIAYKNYQNKANQLLKIYNQLTKKYDLEKLGAGKRASKQKVTRGAFGGLGLENPSMRHTKQYPVGGYTNVK